MATKKKSSNHKHIIDRLERDLRMHRFFQVSEAKPLGRRQYRRSEYGRSHDHPASFYEIEWWISS